MKRLTVLAATAALFISSAPVQAGDTAEVLGGLLALGVAGAAIGAEMQHQQYHHQQQEQQAYWNYNIAMANAQRPVIVTAPTYPAYVYPTYPYATTYATPQVAAPRPSAQVSQVSTYPAQQATPQYAQGQYVWDGYNWVWSY